MEYPSNSNHNGNNSDTASIASIASNNGNGSNPASSRENRKPQTAQQLVRENVQYLIGQLEAGHSDALTAYLNAMSRFTTTRSATSSKSHDRSLTRREWLGCMHGTSWDGG